jgi:hypothetical protein
MWNTEEGVRALKGAEWDLFRLGIELVWDDIEQADEEFPIGTSVAVFDSLVSGQQLALLYVVGQALSDDSIEAPVLTAHNEGTVAAVFGVLRQYVEIECGHDEATTFRASILKAYIECEGDEPAEPDDDPLPGPGCKDVGEWHSLLEGLEGRILWDDDFEMGHLYLDTPPPLASKLMKDIGIPRDYFMAIPPDPSEAEVEKVRKGLKLLVERKR